MLRLSLHSKGRQTAPAQPACNKTSRRAKSDRAKRFRRVFPSLRRESKEDGSKGRKGKERKQTRSDGRKKKGEKGMQCERELSWSSNRENVGRAPVKKVEIVVIDNVRRIKNLVRRLRDQSCCPSLALAGQYAMSGSDIVERMRSG